MRSIYSDELPPTFQPTCGACDDTGSSADGFCACGRGVALREATYEAIRDVIDASNDWDAADDAPTSLRLAKDVCCPACETVSRVVCPWATAPDEWEIRCPHCLDVWGTK